MENLQTQYDKVAQDFQKQLDGNWSSRNAFYNILGTDLFGKTLLDLGCGDGYDIVHQYSPIGAKCFGIDASIEMVELAKKNGLKHINVGTFSDTKFESESFDIVVSKYAMQTDYKIDLVYKEVSRILKPSGIFIFLVVSPLRQFLERRDINGVDYFKQIVVDSHILDDSVTVYEPTHTMNDYLSETFFHHFTLELFHEEWDPAAEQLHNAKYPCFMILRAKKK